GLPARRELVPGVGQHRRGLGLAGRLQAQALLGEPAQVLPPGARGVSSVSAERATTRLKQRIQQREPVLAVVGTPNAFHARIMEAHGTEAAFVGTSITGGNYTGLPDTGVLSASECVQFG